MTFAQALARIEQVLVYKKAWSAQTGEHLAALSELHTLLVKHADSFVQLWKVAEEMRENLQDDIDNPETDTVDYMSCRAYDKLMKGEGE